MSCNPCVTKYIIKSVPTTCCTTSCDPCCNTSCNTSCYNTTCCTSTIKTTEDCWPLQKTCTTTYNSCNPCLPICNPCNPCNPCPPKPEPCNTIVSFKDYSPPTPQAIPTGVTTTLLFNSTPAVNIGGGNYNSSTGQYTVPISGHYTGLVVVTFAGDPTNGGSTVGTREIAVIRIPYGSGSLQTISIDSRLAAGVSPTDYSPTRITLPIDEDLCLGDRIYVTAYQTSGVSVNVFPTYDIGIDKFTLRRN